MQFSITGSMCTCQQGSLAYLIKGAHFPTQVERDLIDGKCQPVAEFYAAKPAQPLSMNCSLHAWNFRVEMISYVVPWPRLDMSGVPCHGLRCLDVVFRDIIKFASSET